MEVSCNMYPHHSNQTKSSVPAVVASSRFTIIVCTTTAQVEVATILKYTAIEVLNVSVSHTSCVYGGHIAQTAVPPCLSRPHVPSVVSTASPWQQRGEWRQHVANIAEDGGFFDVVRRRVPVVVQHTEIYNVTKVLLEWYKEQLMDRRGSNELFVETIPFSIHF